MIVRNITGLLRRAGLVNARQGVAGATLARPIAEITLLDVYRAVETDGELFGIHADPNPNCEVGSRIVGTLEKVFGEAQRAMEARLNAVTMADIVNDLNGSDPR